MITSAEDFIEVYPAALPVDVCSQWVQRFERSGEHSPGRVGGGVMPELKRSRDLQITGKPAWREVEERLNAAMFGGLLRYLRTYPYALIAQLMLQIPDPDSGEPRRLRADDLARKIGRAHVCTPVTNAQLVCRLPLDN